MGQHHSTDTADIIFLLLSLCPIPQVQLDTLQSWSKYFYSFFLANLSLNICTFFLVWFGPWIYFGQWAKHTVSCYDFLWKHFFFFPFFFFLVFSTVSKTVTVTQDLVCGNMYSNFFKPFWYTYFLSAKLHEKGLVPNCLLWLLFIFNLHNSAALRSCTEVVVVWKL